MAFFKFFNLPKPLHFDYQPRFYDPKKEELEKRLKASEARTSDDTEGMKSRISSGLRRRHYQENRNLRARYARQTNIRLMAVLAALVLITLIVLNTWLPSLIEAIEK